MLRLWSKQGKNAKGNNPILKKKQQRNNPIGLSESDRVVFLF